MLLKRTPDSWKVYGWYIISKSVEMINGGGFLGELLLW